MTKNDVIDLLEQYCINGDRGPLVGVKRFQKLHKGTVVEDFDLGDLRFEVSTYVEEAYYISCERDSPLTVLDLEETLDALETGREFGSIVITRISTGETVFKYDA